MEPSDTESSSWSVYSDCDCYRCQYGFSQGAELEAFPFYSSIQQPFVYYAQCRHGHVRKKDCKICRPNCFVRAFRWYTNEHGDKHKPCEGDRLEPRPCDPVPCKDPCNEECEPPRDPPCAGAGPQNLNSFALWLDSKYHEFLAENADACRFQLTETEVRDASGRKKLTTVKKNWKHRVQKCQNRGHNECSRNIHDGRNQINNMSMEFIMTPKNLSHAASECCQPTPTCSAGDGYIVKSQSATATVSLNKSGYGNQEGVKPPMEPRTDPYRTNKNISCQVTHTGHHAQTQYESSQPCNAICPVTPRCPPKPPVQAQATNAQATYVQPTQQIQVSHNKRASTESHSSYKHDKGKSGVLCKCPNDPHNNRTQEHKEEIKSVDFKHPRSAVQQPQADSKQPYTELQQSQPGFQQPLSGLQQPQSGLQQPQYGLQQTQSGLQQPQSGLLQPQSGLQQLGPDFQQTQSYFQQPPYPNSQQPCPDFQQPCPSSQQPASNLPYPCPSVNEPCPGFRPCPTLHAPCPPCEKPNLLTNSTIQQREQNIPQFQSGPQVPYWETNADYQKPRSDIQNASMNRTQKPCPDFQKPCPSLDPASNIFEPCPSLNDPCPGRKPCPSFREPCPPCPKSNFCSSNIQEATNLNISSQNQYQSNNQNYPNFQNYQQQTKYDSQTLYQQQGPPQPPPQMRFESQTRYQQPGSAQQYPQMIFEPQGPYQQPAGLNTQGSQIRYNEKNVGMQYYDYKTNQNPCCLPNAIRREQGPSFVDSTQRVRKMPPKQEDMSLKNCPGNGPGLCNTCSNLVQGACEASSSRRCEPCPECNCQECTTYGSSRCCKRMQMPPVKNVIIATAAAEGKCSSNCPYYSSISNKGETTQTVQFSQHSRDITAQTSSTAIQLNRSTNPEYKLFMKVVCADKL